MFLARPAQQTGRPPSWASPWVTLRMLTSRGPGSAVALLKKSGWVVQENLIMTHDEVHDLDDINEQYLIPLINDPIFKSHLRMISH